MLIFTKKASLKVILIDEPLENLHAWEMSCWVCSFILQKNTDNYNDSQACNLPEPINSYDNKLMQLPKFIKLQGDAFAA